MEVNVVTSSKAPLVLGLVGVEIVEDDMQLDVATIMSHDLIHEIQELSAAALPLANGEIGERSSV